MTNRGRLLALALGAVTVALPLAVPWSAQAAPTITRPDSPGAGYTWGMPTATLPTVAFRDNAWDSSGVLSQGGGWTVRSKRTYRSDGAYPTTPGVMYASEPALNGSVVSVLVHSYHPADNRSGALNPVGGLGGGGGTTWPYAGSMTCQTSEWATSRTTTTFSTSGNSFSANAQWDHITSETARGNITGTSSIARTVSNCPYLVGIKLWWKSYKTGSTVPQWSQTNWGAEAAFLDSAYTDNDYVKEACQSGGGEEADGCATFGGTLPGNYCLGAPEFEWLSFDWIPAVIGHYAECLFVPFGGWDREKTLSVALSESAFNEISLTMAGWTAGWNLGGDCGPLTGPGHFLGVGSSEFEFSMNTCAWSSFAPSIKTALGVFVVIWFGWWATSFFIDTTLGMVNRKVRSPLGGEDDS